MILYFDKKGTLKEVIKNLPTREGSVGVNKIYAYFENETITTATFLSDTSSVRGVSSVKKDLVLVDDENADGLYVGDIDLKYFKLYKNYEVFEHTMTTADLTQGNRQMTITGIVSNTELAMGLVCYNVENSIVLKDNQITESQFTYLLSLIGSITSNDYNDLLHKPSLGGVELVGDVAISSLGLKQSDILNDLGYLTWEGVSGKQNVLVSGVNIKTINGISLLGSGDIEIGGGESGTTNYNELTNKPSINGTTLSGNVNLQTPLVSGTNIKTINNISLLGSGNINIQGGEGGGETKYLHIVNLYPAMLFLVNSKSVEYGSGAGAIADILSSDSAWVGEGESGIPSFRFMITEVGGKKTYTEEDGANVVLNFTYASSTGSKVVIPDTNYRSGEEYVEEIPTIYNTWALNETITEPPFSEFPIDCAVSGLDENCVSLYKTTGEHGWQLWMRRQNNIGEDLYDSYDDTPTLQRYQKWQKYYYRIITFLEEPTGDLLSWLNNNGVRL